MTAEASSVSAGRFPLTWWSLLTVALAIPTWWWVIVSGVMTRDLDGGIFLSVVGGLRQGLPLYSGVWDNKDPLFFGAMVGASGLTRVGPFVMDWLWIPVAAVGSWLLARPVASADRALAVALVATPFLLTSPFYGAGWSNLPGTALLLLALGLLASRRGVVAGIVLGLLAFMKLVLWPIGLLAVLALLLLPDRRRIAYRGLAALGTTLIVGGSLLAVVGWWGGYLDALQRNRTYAADVMVYFGYDNSPLGHLRRLTADWEARSWVAAAAIVVVAIALAALLLSRPTGRSSERLVLAMWLWLSIFGTIALLAFTYVWSHHAQAVYLPAVLATVALVALIPARWPFFAVLPSVLIGTWVLSGTGSPSSAWDRFSVAREAFSTRWAAIDTLPTDAKLLATVPSRNFTFARLGTNDDQGFLYDAPERAHLACAQFHLYDFSPPEDFSRMLACIQSVDVILMTDNFVVFGNGGRAASVQPILQYVDYAFTCLRVDDRQICTRKRT